MKENNTLEGLLDILPNAAKNIKNEVEGFGDSLLKNKLGHLDVVSRKEFEEQRLILNGLLEKVDAIEQMLKALSTQSSQ